MGDLNAVPQWNPKDLLAEENIKSYFSSSALDAEQSSVVIILGVIESHRLIVNIIVVGPLNNQVVTVISSDQ